tara:strand:+ start:22383 stop:22763 length:381 start_codon:yes stop_codon:yes gene_type:complete
MWWYLLAAAILFLFFIRGSNGTSKSTIDKLVRQAARFATAAQQDESPLVSVLHANYSAGYLWALKDIATPKQIHNATGVDIQKFEEHILNVQDMVTKKTLKKCPEFAGDVDLYLATIGGEAASILT